MRKYIKSISMILCFIMVLSLLPVQVVEAADVQEEQSLYYGRYALSLMENGEAYVWVYDRIQAGVEAMSLRIELFDDAHQVTVAEFQMIYDAYINDNGGLFWLNGGYGYSYIDNVVYAVIPGYTMTGDELAQARKEFDEQVELLLSGIEADMTEFEKELYIHDALVNRNNYESDAPNRYNAYGAIVEGASVCDGYAKAFQHLLTCVGIQSHRVTGFGNGGAHAWNYVRIDGKYYQTDATWNDGDTTIFHEYFNMTDAEMGLDHEITYPGYSLPVCDSEDADYFKMTGRIFDPETTTVEDFVSNLLENELVFSAYYEGASLDVYNWFWTCRDQVFEQAHIKGYPRILIGGGNGEVRLYLEALEAAVVQNGETYYYNTVEEAAQACQEGSILRLREDVDRSVALPESVILDLNGCNVAGDITGSGEAYIIDSQSEDYFVRDTAGYGIVSGTVSGVDTMDGYVSVTEEEGTSYHKVGICLKRVNLKAADTGIYYTGKFLYDNVVAQYLATTGVALSTANDAPVADDSDPSSRYTTSANSVLVKNILTEGAADNFSRAKMLIYARAYLKMADGTIVYSETTATNLKTLVETVDTAAWAKLTTPQKDTLKTMYATFADIMGSWKINNLKSA